MMRQSTRSRNIFKRLIVSGVNSTKTDVQNNCLWRLYEADAELKAISSELDSFDGKKDPVRCNLLVNQLRTAQDKVISLLFQLMDDCNCERASRDYRMKFPDEILLSDGSESLNGQIWFGAECLSAGSNILNHTKESALLRPMAKTLTQHLDSLRNDLRDLVIDGCGAARINHTLIKKMVAFDHIFATFEYEYVRTMLPIRTVAEIEKLQEVAVLFSETLIDCVKRKLIKQEDIDEFQPIVMIAVPRLAIVRGLSYKNDNPIYTRHKSHMCSLFQPFHGPLHSIKKLLRGLSPQELFALEKMLAYDQSSNTEPSNSEEDEDVVDTNTDPNTRGLNSDATNTRVCLSDQTGCPQQMEFEDQQAGASSNYSNILMEGLQYPVGHKRCDEETESCDSHPLPEERSTANSQSIKDDCYLDVHTASTKDQENECGNSHDARNARRSILNSPDNSTPTPSSSLSSTTAGNKCHECLMTNDCAQNCDDHEEAKRRRTEHQTKECDNDNCCLSPPDSESQLEKLIADLDPALAASSTNCIQDLGPNRIVAGASAAADSPPTTSNNPTSIAHSSTRESVIVYSGTPQTLSATTEADKRSKHSAKTQELDHSTNLARDENEAALEELFQRQAQQMLHRLFVAISGVADQLQSNFASDLRFILRHIFSSEIAAEEEDEADRINSGELLPESDDGEYSNDHSDCSMPIEQGIEAQEVANLIDLGYTVNDTYAIDQDDSLSPTSATLAGNSSPYNSNPINVTDLDHFSASSSVFMPSRGGGASRSDSAAANSMHMAAVTAAVLQENQEVLADLMRAAGNTEPIFDSRASPNDPSTFDSGLHRSLIQHSRSSRQAHGQGQEQMIGENQVVQHNIIGETRRSRHHGSRARRSRGPPVWVPDRLVIQCSCCNAQFTLFRRRHHCRACGQIFCGDCSRFTRNLNCWGYNGPVRVCEECYNQP